MFVAGDHAFHNDERRHAEGVGDVDVGVHRGGGGQRQTHRRNRYIGLYVATQAFKVYCCKDNPVIVNRYIGLYLATQAFKVYCCKDNPVIVNMYIGLYVATQAFKVYCCKDNPVIVNMYIGLYVATQAFKVYCCKDNPVIVNRYIGLYQYCLQKHFKVYHWNDNPVIANRYISRSSQCSTTGLTKAVVCAILSGMVHIKEPLLLIGNSSPCGGSGFPLSLTAWSFTICLTPYNRK